MEDNFIEAAVERLEGCGYKVYVPDQAYQTHFQFAGTDEQRVAGLHHLFENPDVGAILCSRGGVGSFRLLEMVDYDLIAKNPKPFCGFSDITVLLHAIQQKTNLVTFHGVILYGLRNKLNPTSIETFEQVLSGNIDDSIVFTKDDGIKAVKTGIAEGPMIGGNLTLLTGLIGTEYDFNTDGKIFFIEDVDENLFHLDRQLHHFKRAGKFDNIKGLIVGEIDCLHDDPPYGCSIEDQLRHLLPDADFPIVMDYPCGHGDRIVTFPMGTNVRLDVQEQQTSLSFLEPAVIS